MRRLSLFMTSLLLLVLTACSSGRKSVSEALVNEPPKPAAVSFSDPTTWILGYFQRSQLSREPHSEWFLKGYDAYQPSPDVIAKLRSVPVDGVTIKIVLGTWCPDSRREVPRFMRIANICEFPSALITFIGVDNSKNGPVGEFPSLMIERVPTFIIYKNNVEIGRIIENPATSLEQDIVNILTGNGK